MKKFGLVLIAVVVLSFVSSFSSLLAEEYEGTLEVIMATETGGEKTCQPLYFVNTGNGKKIRFSLPAHAPPLSPGQKIKISGQWEDEISVKKKFNCRKITAVAKSAAKKPLALTSTDNLSGYLPEQNKVLWERKILVVCVTDEEHSPAESWGTEKIEDKIFSNQHSLNAYWKACSGEKVWLTGDVFNDGNWKMMEKKWSEYGYGSADETSWAFEFINDIVSLIDDEVDFTKYDGLIVFRAGNGWYYNWSTTGKITITTNDGEAFFSISVLSEGNIEINNDYAAHEGGHGLFSLDHAQSQSIISGEIHGYGDWWENRGKQYALLDGLHKWILGWLDISQIKIIMANDSFDSFWLEQRELDSEGMKLLVIPLGFDDDGIPILLYLEYHRGLGEFDSQLSFSNTNEAVDPNNLVLIRKYEKISNSPYGDSVVYVASDDGNDCLDLESEEFCDSENGVCVQVLQKIGTNAASQAEVKITLTSDYSVPTPIPTPINKEMTVVVTINGVDAINNDNIVVTRGSRVAIKVRAEIFDGFFWEDLELDKITCEIKNPRGKVKLSEERENTYEGVFRYKIKKKAPLGEYEVKVGVFKKGHKDASFQVKFKAR